MIEVLINLGPNLNMLGMREPEVYGSETMADIIFLLEAQASNLCLKIAMVQSNDEGELVTDIQKADRTARAISFNLAASTHISVALREAVAMFTGPWSTAALSLVLVRTHVGLVLMRWIAYLRGTVIGTSKLAEGDEGWIND